MVLFNLIKRNSYHKNGTQWIGKLFSSVIGEKNYDILRLQRRIMYARFWYSKQNFLVRFQTQWPQIGQYFSLLNKHDTSKGFPIGRVYERYQDFAVFNINHEGWFQFMFFVAALTLWTWNWTIIATNYLTRGDTVEDQDLYRLKDARITTNFDRTKYKFNLYFFGTHQNAVTRKILDDKDHADNPRVSFKFYFNY